MHMPVWVLTLPAACLSRILDSKEIYTPGTVLGIMCQGWCPSGPVPSAFSQFGRQLPLALPFGVTLVYPPCSLGCCVTQCLRSPHHPHLFDWFYFIPGCLVFLKYVFAFVSLLMVTLTLYCVNVLFFFLVFPSVDDPQCLLRSPSL